MDCPFCYFSFNIATRIPKIIPKCGMPINYSFIYSSLGHTICLKCLKEIS